jgi:hypothetical protein
MATCEPPVATKGGVLTAPIGVSMLKYRYEPSVFRP